MVTAPLAFVQRDEQEMETYLHVGRSVCGHDGIIHGGLLATILDEAMGCVVRDLRSELLSTELYSRRAFPPGYSQSRAPRRGYSTPDHKLSLSHAG